LQELKQRFPEVGDVRGRGCLFGIELVSDRESREPANDLADKVLYESLSRGLSFKTTMGNILTFTPPLTINEQQLNQALEIAHTQYPIFSVKIFNHLKAGLVITGNEVYDGLIEDKFEAIVSEKLKALGASLVETIILPDDESMIADNVRLFLDKGIDLIITTGGMSVDPDDVTRSGIRKAGVDHMLYGAAALPGAMFMLAYKGDVPIVGLPACALYHKTTVFDLILPRLLAGEKPDNKDLARFAPGGLCFDCPTCNFPACSFGKTG
jgi:molybdenum cofactor synthesis domain-containing protein